MYFLHSKSNQTKSTRKEQRGWKSRLENKLDYTHGNKNQKALK
jgi:hypothetical protein